MKLTHSKLAGNVYLVNINGPLNVTHAGEVNRYFVQLAGKGAKRTLRLSPSSNSSTMK